MSSRVLVRDYLQTSENLYFAVVSDLVDSGRHLCNLRYAVDGDGIVHKFDTDSAGRYLSEHFPRYLFYSDLLDVSVHGLRETDIQQILRPQDTVSALLAMDQNDHKYKLAGTLLVLFEQRGISPARLGITGSIMLGFHGPGSDIDFVVYGRDEFNCVRRVIRELQGDSMECQPDIGMWMDSYRRRDCDLDFQDYVKHERRKYNKLLWQGTKIDFSCVQQSPDYPGIHYPVRKVPACYLQARITDDSDVFSYPARYITDDADIREILSYTATYAGQAFRDEKIEARGPVEIDANGVHRMVIGTSREARGEYIRVPGL